ncbi:hypothetical protein BX070DRAFT_153363 [Coemansia spiralis]|nr:hypothetical protein BX070DRAFT_153363 [Coemansia spiralis]
MLKAFSKVFHKTPPQDTSPDGHSPGDFVHAQATESQNLSALQQGAKRASGLQQRQQHPAGLGIQNPQPMQAGLTNISSPNRTTTNGARLAWPLASDAAVASAAYPAGEHNKRISLHHRMEQQLVQPRLHLKGSAHGVDGRFALTSDNIEWHLRLIPSMKESKYDRILRYVQAQQQNISAAAEPGPQLQPDIDSSLLMSGGPMNHDYIDSPYNAQAEQISLQQQQQQQFHQSQNQHVRTSIHPLYGATAGSAPMLSPLQMQQAQHNMGAMVHVHSFVDRDIAAAGLHYQGLNSNHIDPRSTQIVNSHANASTTAKYNMASEPSVAPAPGVAQEDNEEDDNTPLAAINVGSNPRQQSSAKDAPQPLTKPNAAAGTSLEKYAAAISDDQLPGLIAPNSGARASMISFQSNMVANFNSEANGGVSLSISNPRSASIFESHYRTTPVPRSPTVLDPVAQHMSTHSGSVRHSSIPSAKIYTRPSLDAITPTSRDKRNSSGDSGVEAVPSNKADVKDQQKRFTANINSHYSEDEDDNVPLGKQRPMSSGAVFQVSGGIASQLKQAFTSELDTGDIDSPLKYASNHRSASNITITKTAQQQPLSKRQKSLSSADSGSDSASSVALRVANQPSIHESDESADDKDIDDAHVVPETDQIKDGGHDEDNQPLMQLSKRQDQKQQQSSLYVITKPKQQHLADSNNEMDGEDDDDQPLSSLLFQQNSASDDLGSLPLPMPRHVIDPDAIVNMNDMVNEVAMPLRKSIGESPVSPLMSRGSLVRKNSTLSRSFRMSAQEIDPADGTGDYIRSPMPVKRRSNLSAYTDSAMVNGRTSFSPSTKLAMDGNLIVEGDTESEGTSDDDNEPKQSRDLESVGRPWAKDREYSPSASSLNSHRRTQRGSTLGQQLTDELQKLREDIARARRDNERTERRSWQVGDPVLMQQPWTYKENTLSESALPQKLQTLQKLTAGADAAVPKSLIGNDIHNAGEEANNDEVPRFQSSWSYNEKQRPLSVQPQRKTRWFGKSNGVSADDGSNTPSLHASTQQLKENSPATIPNTPVLQQNNHGQSLSTRFNAKFGKLKKTFKHHGAM